MTLEERFWKKVTIVISSTHCWIWTGAASGGKHGKYGGIKVNKKMAKATRVSWEIHNGKIPENMEVCHSCDNTICVNPKHLWVGTHKQNMRDRDRKGRMKAAFGENHGRAKLTEEKVKEIRYLFKNGNISKSKFARQFEIGRYAILSVISRRTWKHI